jgi:1-hydroxycarotenoid 3,4-desaturase
VAEHRVAVVGAGIGGIVAGLQLAARGLDVTLFEAADAPGGKMRPVHAEGQAIDAGPTVFTMRWVFDELLAEAGSSLAALLPGLQPLPVLARHAWAADGSVLDLFADRARSADAIAAWSSAAEARRYLAFCDEAARVYRRLEGPHIRSSRPGFWRMVGDLGPRGLATLAALGPLATLAGALGRRFEDPRLRQLFGRYATYCGANPWAAPATLMLVAHVEQEGVWSVPGGMGALARALSNLLVERGGRIRYGARVEAITAQGGRATGVQLAGGEHVVADSVVFNGDAGALAPLLGRPARPLPPRQRPGGRCRRSPGPAARPPMGWRWSATPCSSTPTTPANSTTCSCSAACRGAAPCTSARRTAPASSRCAPARPSGCCCSSTPRPMATGARSPRWRPRHAKPAP